MAAPEDDPANVLLDEAQEAAAHMKLLESRFKQQSRPSIGQVYNTFANAPNAARDKLMSGVSHIMPSADYKYNAEKRPLAAGTRVSLNFQGILANILGPWVFFTVLYVIFCNYGLLLWVLLLGLFIAAMFGSMAYRSLRRRGAPMWYGFACLAMLLAVGIAAGMGELVFKEYLGPYYVLQSMATYTDVDPGHDPGRKLMDAGRVYFQEGTGLDTRKAIGFKNVDQYCVAPIAKGHQQLYSYDYWAVGINCCSGGADFSCGAHNDPYARAGLRIADVPERAMFRLAVQQAEANYNIKATHPLFFYWMQSPAKQMKEMRTAGFHLLFFGIVSHFFFNLVCVLLALCLFSKIGH